MLELEQNIKRKWLVVVIYDVPDDKRRKALHDFLESYGVRIQKSAFECKIDAWQYKSLVEQLNLMIDPEVELVKLYKLNDSIEVLSWGQLINPPDEEYSII